MQLKVLNKYQSTHYTTHILFLFIRKKTLIIPKDLLSTEERDWGEKKSGEWIRKFFTFQFSCSVMSDSLWPHGPQLTRLPCPSPSPRVCLSSCPLNQWWHPTISSSVTSFFSCLQSFSVSESFPMSRLFISGGQSIGASASASVLSMNIHSGVISFRIDWFDLAVPETLKSLL